MFRDVHSIGVGRWRDKIDAALERSAACVAVIGPRWANDENLARLAEDGDMVRYELLTALGSDGLTMVPTLVEGAPLPASTRLPPELRPLFDTWNARPVTEDGWEDDTRRLIREVAEATTLPVGPDLDALLHTAAAAEQRVAELERARNLQPGQNEALQGTLAELTAKLAEAPPAERSTVAAAFAALAKGDTRAAEDEFEREYERQDDVEQESLRAAAEARRRKADAARNVANLALLHDTEKAVRFYRHALDLDPGDAETARLLGNALITLGDLPGARTALSQAAALARANGSSFAEMAALGDLGRVEQRLGNPREADAALARSLELAKRLCVDDPDNPLRQLDLSNTWVRIGDLREEQGDARGAKAAYVESLDIAEALAAADRADSERQRALLIGLERIGDMLMKHGDAADALEAYEAGHTIARALEARDPAHPPWRRDLANSHDRIGNVRAKEGDVTAARAAYEAALAIREALAADDPLNAERQRDLTLSHDRIGDMLLKQGDAPAARAAYEKGLAVAQALADRDRTNTQWQRDLAVSLDKVGDMSSTGGDKRDALKKFRQSIAIAKTLVARDPKVTLWQTDLVRSHYYLGTFDYGQTRKARHGHLQKARDILLKLKARGQLPAHLDSGIVEIDAKLAELVAEERSAADLKATE